MIYRPKSSNLWFNLPGVVAAYQPVAAPDPLAARQNMGAGLLGRYTATPGVAPTFASRTGWTFNGSTQYLTTPIVPSVGTWSALVRYTNVTGTNSALFGTYWGANPNGAWLISDTTNDVTIYDGAEYPTGIATNAPRLGTGVYGLANRTGYRNGIAEPNKIAVRTVTLHTIYIGALHYYTGEAVNFCNGTINAVAIYSRTLSASEVWTASQQMKYCNINPDWNVWAPKRRYILIGQYATAAGRVGIYGRRPTIALPGGVSIQNIRGDV